ncbi:aspartic proteinase nepenthesin-1-like [Punica granatum]|uniref:Aspartic proteinase nepenthesin-1-like n=1 Tax=Punica granatum TaxID=22663 RepID=A0A218XUW6_PUNGR|nr:aspartic proteinase nepenthesin-1-like [Punica granatum]OWM88744.1 hypothetical protein CDL15_Pgr002511 [Punica granatum]
MVVAFSPNMIFYYLAIHSIVCFVPSESIGFTLRLIPRFSPESPLYPGNLTFEEQLDQAIEISKSRANYSDFLSTPESSLSPDNIRFWVRPDNFFYTTEVTLGTPTSPQQLLVDTGSGLIWTQCAPCINCYDQSIPIFNRDQSRTYSKVPCDDPICARHKCLDGECAYQINYGGGAVSRGLVSKETFTFTTNQGLVRVPNIVFGCGDDNQRFAFDRRGISGILGLDMGPDSLTMQLFNQIQGRFSYCLVYSKAEMTASSPLRFGEDTVLPPRPDIQTISIVKQRRFKNIYVKLVDVSVGDKRLGFPPGTFDLDTNTGRGGCMFDTGALGMYFNQGPYDAVMKEFDDHFSSFGLKRVSVSKDLRYCYNYHPKFQAYAKMTLHFPTADYVVEPTYLYLHYERKGYFCVGVFIYPGQQQQTIIGSWLQQDMRLLYDLNVGVIRFMPENCAADQ